MINKKPYQFEVVYKEGTKCPLKRPERRRYSDHATAYAEAVRLSVALHKTKQPYEISVFQWGYKNLPTKVAYFAS
jgi:hypothetical protein